MKDKIVKKKIFTSGALKKWTRKKSLQNAKFKNAREKMNSFSQHSKNSWILDGWKFWRFIITSFWVSLPRKCLKYKIQQKVMKIPPVFYVNLHSANFRMILFAVIVPGSMNLINVYVYSKKTRRYRFSNKTKIFLVFNVF